MRFFKNTLVFGCLSVLGFMNYQHFYPESYNKNKLLLDEYIKKK